MVLNLIRLLAGVWLALITLPASAAWFFACEGAPTGTTVCAPANYRWIEVGTPTPSSYSIFSGSDAACNWGWQPASFVGTIDHAAICPTNPGDGGAWCHAFSCTSMTIAGAPPTCTPPEVLQGGVCAPCASGSYYSGGSCVAEPTCVLPQVLNTSTHTCQTPDPVCVLPQILNTSTHLCYTPDPTCVLPQVLDAVNHVCYTPTVTCTPPQVLQGGVCVTPAVIGDCVPSIRTVGDCPAGYAPSTATVGQNLDSYTGGFDGMPIQDMLYAIGISVCALLGIATGVRLT